MSNRLSSPLIALALPAVAFLFTTVAAGRARAQVPAETAEVAHPYRRVSVTVSPLHLTLPVVEFTGEYRVLDKLGVAVVVGAGKITPDGTPGLPTPEAVSVWEAGVQGRYYVVGDFRHGMQLGGELMYLHASRVDSGISAVADGIAVGPFVGYKVMADVGFTFDCQLGYQFFGFGSTATNGQTMTSARRSDGGVLLNVNLGWSF